MPGMTFCVLAVLKQSGNFLSPMPMSVLTKERSKSTIASMKRDWMQGEQNVVAKVAGNLTLHVPPLL